jgi:hypothetical protein
MEQTSQWLTVVGLRPGDAAPVTDHGTLVPCSQP